MSLYACLLGFILDLFIGDPQWRFHPIRLIGNLIMLAEKTFKRIFAKTDRGELFAGLCMTIFVGLSAFLVPFFLIKFAYMIHPFVAFCLETILCFFALSTKCLKVETMKIHKLLTLGEIEKSKNALSMIVGRDTKNLTEEGIIKAAVETVAENTTDGVIAPMLFMIIGGAPFAYFYKAVNTMDSMVGYKNEKYLYFGRCSAKLDDVLNYIPARIAANVMIFSSHILKKFDGKNARRIYLRDRFKHSSPNSAHTEAACAGALRIQLAGDAYYFGVKKKKDYIGDALMEITPDKILMANKLLYTTAVLSLILFSVGKFIIVCLFGM